jgi:hypothetical protein
LTSPDRSERSGGGRIALSEPAARPACKVVKREKDRWREVRDPRDELVCVTVYKRGAVEVVRRFAA